MNHDCNKIVLYRPILRLLVAGALGLAAATAVAVPPSKSYVAVLEELNDSGASGAATLLLEDGLLTVTINVSGVEEGVVHPQHIHGHTVANRGNARNATCPTLAADANGDGIIQVGEGVPAYGPVLLSLQPFSLGDGGVIDFSETYDFDKDWNPLQKRAIVIHGLTIDGEYVVSTPIACGQIEALEDDD